MCPGGTPSGAPVTNLNGAEQALVGAAGVMALTHYATMTDGSLGTVQQQQEAKKDGKLVNFLRGQRGNEDFTSNSLTKLFRKREAVLGDIVDSQPVYVGQPFANYQEHNYTAFKTTARTPMLYVGANDGMLHAFYATVNMLDVNHGQEAWAVIPSAVLPNLYKLADDNYKRDGHQFYVDGTPVAGDVWNGTRVADDRRRRTERRRQGLLRARRDEPGSDADPAVGIQAGVRHLSVAGACGHAIGHLLRLQPGPHVRQADHHQAGRQLGRHRHLGLQQRQRRLRRWPGLVYVLDALTGELKQKITTGSGAGLGDAATPSGLAQLNNYVDNVDIDNTTLRAYGGDVLGNIWRFDFVAGTATRLGPPRTRRTTSSRSPSDPSSPSSTASPSSWWAPASTSAEPT